MSKVKEEDEIIVKTKIEYSKYNKNSVYQTIDKRKIRPSISGLKVNI